MPRETMRHVRLKCQYLPDPETKPTHEQTPKPGVGPLSSWCVYVDSWIGGHCVTDSDRFHVVI